MFPYFGANFVQSLRQHFIIEISVDKFWFLNSFQKRNIKFFCSVIIWLAESSKTCTCMWYFLGFWFICLQNYLLEFFHHAPSGQFCQCKRLPDKHILQEYVPCIRTLRLKLAKVWLLVTFFYRLISSESTGSISTIKISQDSFKF